MILYAIVKSALLLPAVNQGMVGSFLLAMASFRICGNSPHAILIIRVTYSLISAVKVMK